MDVSTIAKDNICIQKRYLNNIFDTLTLFQDYAEKTSRCWAYQMGVEDNARSAIDQFRVVLKQGCDDARELINECFTDVEVYFAGTGSKQPAEKK
jgi:hypothetical protein